MELQELEFGSDRYREALALRQRVLRDPLGLEWTAEEREAEPLDRHFAAIDGEVLVGCVVARKQSCGVVKLRQMAVAPERQGSGAGRWLLERVENVFRDEGVRRFVLHARETARGFYEKLGYAAVGERFTEVGVPHWRMEKFQS